MEPWTASMCPLRFRSCVQDMILSLIHIYHRLTSLITLPTAKRLDHACKKFWRSRYLLLMLLPALIWYIAVSYTHLAYCRASGVFPRK